MIVVTTICICDRPGCGRKQRFNVVMQPGFWLCDDCHDAYVRDVNRPESPELLRLQAEVERAGRAYDEARRKEFPSAEEWAKLNPVAKSGGSL